jgi:hypothetical protein
VCSSDLPELGWQWACPTRTGKGKEQFGVIVTEAQLKQIADSKRVSKQHKGEPHQHVIIISVKGAVAPAAPAPAAKPVPCPACGGTGVKK